MEISTLYFHLLLKFINLIQSFCCGPWCLIQIIRRALHYYDMNNNKVNQF